MPRVTCGECHGKRADEYTDCPSCDGKGVHEEEAFCERCSKSSDEWRRMEDSGYFGKDFSIPSCTCKTIRKKCGSCRGTGKKKNPSCCWACKGKGTLQMPTSDNKQKYATFGSFVTRYEGYDFYRDNLEN